MCGDDPTVDIDHDVGVGIGLGFIRVQRTEVWACAVGLVRN